MCSWVVLQWLELLWWDFLIEVVTIGVSNGQQVLVLTFVERQIGVRRAGEFAIDYRERQSNADIPKF